MSQARENVTERPSPIEEYAAIGARLDGKNADEICRWAIERFGRDLVVAASFQDCVLIDVVHRVDPGAEFVFLDTCFHFPETLSFVDEVAERYGLNLTVLRPSIPLDESPCGSPRCCELRKVEPLNATLREKSAWITGLKRVDTPERANAPVVSFDELREVVKVNPLAAWSDDDIDEYVAEHQLPRHPLNAKGYVSIGCAPTTRPIASGEDPRVGRWPDSDKTECGLHL
ncbi:MAG: phosphoadenylyl-sulfate reductase [Acidimicrobiales bacterium]